MKDSNFNIGAGVTVSVSNDTYTKLGATIVISVILAAFGYFLIKNMIG